MNVTPNFDMPIQEQVPAACDLLKSAGLTVHESVSKIVLHGSRGLANRYRLDSDIDLTLITEIPEGMNIDSFLEEVAEVTISRWRSDTELDLAVVFDKADCGLLCFERTSWDDSLCASDGSGCFGVYKSEEGFRGVVSGNWVQAPLMYPCLVIWRRGD